MDLITNLFNQNNFKPFNFSDDFQAVCEQNDLDGISVGKYLLIKKHPGDLLKILMHDNQLCYLYFEEILLSSEQILNFHGIYPAKCLTRRMLEKNQYSISKDYNRFCLALFQREYYWLQKFLHWIHHYLETRVAFGEVLIKQEAIRLILSEVVENMAIAHVFLDKKHIEKNTRQLLSEFVLKAIKKLANCTGGRELAGGNILEFYYVTQLVNHFLCQ